MVGTRATNLALASGPITPGYELSVADGVVAPQPANGSPDVMGRKVASERLYEELAATAGGPAPSRLATLPGPDELGERGQTSDKIHDGLADAVGALNFTRKEQGLRADQRRIKQGHGKTLSRTNTRIQRSHRDMIRGIRDTRVAAMVGRSSPESAKQAMNRMALMTTGFNNLIRPQLEVMRSVHASNLQILDSHSSERTFVGQALGRTGPGGRRGEVESAAYTSSSGVRFDVDEGRFEMAQTRNTVRDALSLVDEAVNSMRDAIDNLKQRQSITPKQEGYQRKQLARFEARHGSGDGLQNWRSEPDADPKNIRLGSEMVSLATLERDRENLATSFRELSAMDTFVA
ncbi:MAG: hypothetical protein AMXMBFR33_28780 [Candidatus Xenobia bacterium]